MPFEAVDVANLVQLGLLALKAFRSEATQNEALEGLLGIGLDLEGVVQVPHQLIQDQLYLLLRVQLHRAEQGLLEHADRQLPLVVDVQLGEPLLDTVFQVLVQQFLERGPHLVQGHILLGVHW